MLVVTSALLVVTMFAIRNKCTLVVTSALLVVTMFAIRNKCHASSNKCLTSSNNVCY